MDAVARQLSDTAVVARPSHNAEVGKLVTDDVTKAFSTAHARSPAQPAFVRHGALMPFEPRCRWPHVEHPVRVDPLGRAGPTPGQARGPHWRSVGNGFFVPSETDSSVVEQRVVEAAVHLPPEGAITGWAALRVAGATYFDGTVRGRVQPVALAAGGSAGRRRKPGISWTYERIDGEEVTLVHALRTTTPARALYDELRRPGLGVDAVVAVDMALAAGVVSWAEIDACVTDRRGFRRSHLAQAALSRADGGSRSPTETRLREHCRRRLGLTSLRTNQPVFDLRGRLICIADLFDEQAGLVLEYDGAAHRTAERQHRDVVRADRCRTAGLEYCVVTSLDLRNTAPMNERILAARRRGLAATHRGWTLDRPPGWRMPWSTAS